MIFIGIDPGVVNGGLATIERDKAKAIPIPTITLERAGKKRKTYDIPELELLFGKLSHENCRVELEKQFPMPQQGGVSMFSIGYGFGLLQGLFVGFGITYDIVAPKEWQKSFGIFGKKGNTKEQALEVCKELFPDVNLLATKRSKKAHEGLVDAILIAEYAKRRYEKK